MTHIPTTNKSLETIIGQLRQELPRLREEYAIDTLAIFGSYARNTQQPTSDIDILVSFHITPGLLKYISLEQDLSDLLGVPVDLCEGDRCVWRGYHGGDRGVRITCVWKGQKQ